MKRTIFTYGIISGLIIAALMAATIPFASKDNMNMGMVIGYTTMLIAFSLIFFAVSSYKKNHNLSALGFKKTFQIGISISIISSLFYVVTWLIIFYNFMPDFMTDYINHQIAAMEKAGASAKEINSYRTQQLQFAENYKNPFFNAAITFTEIFPVGLLMTLIAATIEHFRKKRQSSTSAAVS